MGVGLTEDCTWSRFDWGWYIGVGLTEDGTWEYV